MTLVPFMNTRYSRFLTRLAGLCFLSFPLNSAIHAEASVQGLKPETVYLADSKKTQVYVRDGVVTGGDHSIREVVIRDIRFSNQDKFERLVVDMIGTKNGDQAALKRPPYFHVSVTPSMSRIDVTFFGNPKIHFSPKKVVRAFQKSRAIERIEFLPPIEPDRVSFSLHLKTKSSVEVFELGDPTRVILDLKRI